MSAGGLFLDFKQLKCRVRNAKLNLNKDTGISCTCRAVFSVASRHSDRASFSLGTFRVLWGLPQHWACLLCVIHLFRHNIGVHHGVNSSSLWRQWTTASSASHRLQPASACNLGGCKAQSSTPDSCRLWALPAPWLHAVMCTDSMRVRDDRISGLGMPLPTPAHSVTCAAWLFLLGLVAPCAPASRSKQHTIMRVFAEKLLLSLPSLTRLSPLGYVQFTLLCIERHSLCSDCNTG